MNSTHRHPSKGIILVVDDTPENLRMLSLILKEQGYKVRAVPNGILALSSAQTMPPDLILLDIMMPEITGFEVCEQLKADERTRDIPVIFISALDQIFNKVKAFSLGGVDYLTKPFQAEEVIARVKIHLTLRNLQKKLQEKNARLQQEISERKQAEAALAEANQELRRLASLDGLTQLANRRLFDNYLHQEWKRSAREQTPLSLILCDIDYFKQYNDTYGHVAGDECLQQIAQGIDRAARRPADLAARYGGEEFVVILPNTGAEGAMHVARAIQEEVCQLNIPHAQSSVSPHVTLSIGVSNTIPNRTDSPELLVNTADKAMYEAKAQGRNAIILKILELPGSNMSYKSCSLFP